MIRFFNEDISFSLNKKNELISWLENVISSHSLHPGPLNYIFCSDEYLLNINRKFLTHDYFTDIITFDNSESSNEIAGDIFISIERVKENSESIGTNFYQELSRVIIHGLLHLLGFDDKTEADKLLMVTKEEEYLSLLKMKGST
ncbi:MAG: rRNA maturation RNase YbeY [Ekhidna sp.]|nr:rRNA maturation RNase YbeY [Ekhidna sp.]